jgi:cbb3-type cytochrome oxidase cytochrome c subunit
MVRKVFFMVFLLIVCITILSVGCTQKAVPVITSRTTEQPKKESVRIIIAPDLAVGKAIFINRCDKCHDLPLHEQFTAQRWEGILSYMLPKARLNEEQGVHVSAFLKANAGK